MELYKVSTWFSRGHCIGVDPYYLTHKAKSLNIKPQMIWQGEELMIKCIVLFVKIFKILRKNIVR